MRALARFWFNRGNAPLGRRVYEDSLQLELPDTDSMRHFQADTYLLWARVERDFGFKDESQRVQALAVSAAERIGRRQMREDMLGQIREGMNAPVLIEQKLEQAK